MELWTVQNEIVWDVLAKDGVWRADEAYVEFPAYEDSATWHAHCAYCWLAERMAERVGPPPENVRFPVWAWYKQQGRQDGKPDMRTRHGMPGERVVRLKLEVADERVLLTDFDDWFFPLNYSYASRTESDDQVFTAWCESLGIGYFELQNWDLDTPELREARRRIEESWECVFDIWSPRDGNWDFPWELRSIQATFWELRRDDVLSVEHFTVR